MATRDFTEQVKIGLAAGGIMATFIAAAFARLHKSAQGDEKLRLALKNETILAIGPYRFNAAQTLIAALLVFACFGTLNYNRYNKSLLVDGYDEYDLLHYYVSAKYFDEVEYFRLLPAMIIADNEAGPMCPGQAPIYLAEDQDTYKRQPISHALAQTEEVKSHFTPQRWEAFVHDFTYIQRASGRLTCPLWRQLLQDHGFNGTPTWVLIARPIVKVIPVESIKLAADLDILWIAGLLVAIAWAFGLQPALLAWIFITVSYSFRWPTISWALLRYDWLATMVIGICLARKRKYTLSGACFAYATLMRYFPGLWLFGILAKGIHHLVTRKDIPIKQFWRRVPTRYYKMALGFFATLALLLSLSFAIDGLGVHRSSLKNMSAHVEASNLSSMRQGLAVALAYHGELDQQLINNDKRELVGRMETPLRIAALVALVGLGLFFIRGKDWEVLGLGLIPYFWLTTSSYYYYSMRLTAVLIHAADLSKKRNVVGLIILFAIELFSNATEQMAKGNRWFLIGAMGWMLALYSIVMVGFFAVDWYRNRGIAIAEEEG